MFWIFIAVKRTTNTLIADNIFAFDRNYNDFVRDYVRFGRNCFILSAIVVNLTVVWPQYGHNLAAIAIDMPAMKLVPLSAIYWTWTVFSEC